MRQVVAFDRTDYWEVIGDYSGSPRHASLSASAWQNEFATHPSYAQMRATQQGAVGMLSPCGVGKWLKDWSGPYVPPKP
jgi:hypothetical protein